MSLASLIPLPLRIAVVTAIGTALIVGGLWALDEYGDRRVTAAKVVWDAGQERLRLAAEEAARQSAEDAEKARLGALLPGSIARLRAEWCRDCQEAR